MLAPSAKVARSVSTPPAQSILDALTVALALVDTDGIIIAVNARWREFASGNDAGRPDHFIGTNYLDVCDRASGVDGASAQAAANGIRSVLAGEAEFSLDYPCHSPNRKRWFQLRVSRLENSEGVFAVLAHHDITKRVQAERDRQALLLKAEHTSQRQKLLIRELHHRVRNTLATVQALLGATMRSEQSSEEFYRSFSSRIASLSNINTILTEDYWQTASLREMLEFELCRPAERARRVVLEGPPVELSADLAIPTGMALHELRTNAVKHGALSGPRGTVKVAWDLVREDGKRKLDLEWIERGGPPVRVTPRNGFGSTLLRHVLTHQCHADVDLEMDRAGLRFRMKAPLVERRLVPEY